MHQEPSIMDSLQLRENECVHAITKPIIRNFASYLESVSPFAHAYVCFSPPTQAVLAAREGAAARAEAALAGARRDAAQQVSSSSSVKEGFLNENL
jgi:hypothetical protein